VIEGFVGAAVWRVLEPFAPWIPHSPTIFAIAGMVACVGSISRAPLAVMLLVASMTPAMLAVGIATLIVQRSDATIYRSQFGSRKDLPPSQQTDEPPLGRPARSLRWPPAEADPGLARPGSTRRAHWWDSRRAKRS